MDDEKFVEEMLPLIIAGDLHNVRGAILRRNLRGKALAGIVISASTAGRMDILSMLIDEFNADISTPGLVKMTLLYQGYGPIAEKLVSSGAEPSEDFLEEAILANNVQMVSKAVHVASQHFFGQHAGVRYSTPLGLAVLAESRECALLLLEKTAVCRDDLVAIACKGTECMARAASHAFDAYDDELLMFVENHLVAEIMVQKIHPTPRAIAHHMSLGNAQISKVLVKHANENVVPYLARMHDQLNKENVARVMETLGLDIADTPFEMYAGNMNSIAHKEFGPRDIVRASEAANLAALELVLERVSIDVAEYDASIFDAFVVAYRQSEYDLVNLLAQRAKKMQVAIEAFASRTNDVGLVEILVANGFSAQNIMENALNSGEYSLAALIEDILAVRIPSSHRGFRMWADRNFE